MHGDTRNPACNQLRHRGVLGRDVLHALRPLHAPRWRTTLHPRGENASSLLPTCGSIGLPTSSTVVISMSSELSLLVVCASLALAGCLNTSPCPGTFVNGNGECPDGCDGIGVSYVHSPCTPGSATAARWCVPNDRYSRDIARCIVDDDTGRMYAVGQYPDAWQPPPNIRFCTQEEQFPPACFPPAAP